MHPGIASWEKNDGGYYRLIRIRASAALLRGIRQHQATHA